MTFLVFYTLIAILFYVLVHRAAEVAEVDKEVNSSTVFVIAVLWPLFLGYMVISAVTRREWED